MKKVIVAAVAPLIVNIVAGFLLSAYPLANMLMTSLAILVNALLVGVLFQMGAESTHRLSLGMIFLVVGIMEFFSGFFAPARLMDNWWVILFVALTAAQCVLTYLTIHYSKKA